ncbi:MAG: PASTA domain-containing protein [Oscillospiraceae bacterium]|jgi:stage V sporulation protein D (sporulation-specific penicillin-binding protein)|nr:PASTA domain-containing protein [Oscillospiraceae bacterium]
MKKKKQTTSDRLFQRAMIVLLLLIFGGFGVGVYGLVKVQLVHGKEYAARAKESQLRDTEVAARRGSIFDSNMREIAQSASAGKVYINPSSLNKALNKDEIINALCAELAPILGITEEKVRKQASYTNRNFMTLKGQVSRETMDKVETFRNTKLKIRLRSDDQDDENATKTVKSTYAFYVGTQPDVVRYYPLGSLAANVIGFTGAEDIGRAGLELFYDDKLTGVPGRIVSAKNAADGNLAIEYESMNDPVPGYSLVLTIDEVIQRYLERALEQAKVDSKAKGAYGIVMDVKTGAIVGMACANSFDPGNYQAIADPAVRDEIAKIGDEKEREKAYNTAMMAQWRNGCIELTYEPGSVFKTVTYAAALEEGVVDMNERFTCAGSLQVANRRIRCHKRSGHGTQTLTQGLMNSCNPFAITLGQKLGVEKFYQYMEGFGFTERTGIDLPNEYSPKKGINIHAQENMHIVELASCSFGQSFEASPMQIITAVSAIANGGKLMQPYIVAKELDENGSIIKETQPTMRRQVVSEDTAKKVAGMMEQVVSEGTGKNGYVAGARVAGKTGTSQKLSVGQGYVASFSCFAPADDPRYALLIAIDEPVGLINGGQIAAPPAAEIMEEVLVYKNIEMRYTEKEKEELGGAAPDVTQKEIADAEELLQDEGYRVKVIGEGKAVLHQIPEPGQSIAPGGLLILFSDESSAAQTVTVPKLTGMGIAAAAREAASAGLNIRLTGNFNSNTLITFRQSIPAGAQAALGETVTVHFVSNNGVIDRVA